MDEEGLASSISLATRRASLRNQCSLDIYHTRDATARHAQIYYMYKNAMATQAVTTRSAPLVVAVAVVVVVGFIRQRNDDASAV